MIFLFTPDVYNYYNLWSCQKVCHALVYLSDNIFIRFGTKLYRQTIGIPMGTNCVPLVADLYHFCYERNFMKSLSRENQADIIEAFNPTSWYLDNLLNIDNIYFDQMVDRIYPTELQLNRAILSIPRHLFWIWIYVYLMVQFPPKFMINGTVLILIQSISVFWMVMSPRRTSNRIYLSQFIRFTRASSNFNDFNCRNKVLTAKLHRQGYSYFKLRKAFSTFYRRHSALVEKYSVSLKTLLQQGISEPEFYGDLVSRFRKIVGNSNFSEQFRKFFNGYKTIGYSLDIIRQTEYLVVIPSIVNGYASLFNCTTASDSMAASS